jgi:hypothetical protein
LKATIDEMSRAFLSFNDKAVGSGILNSNIELTRELRNTTEQFVNLAKAVGSPSGGENSDWEQESTHTNDAIPATITKMEQRPSTSPINNPEQPRHVDIGLGYTLFSDTSSETTPPPLPSDVSYPEDVQIQSGATTQALQPYSSATSNYGILPYTTAPENMATTLTSYNVRLPPSPPFPLTTSPLKIATIQAPYSYSKNETTFSRRIQRAALERGLHLLQTAASRPHDFKRVFKLSLLHHNYETLVSKFSAQLSNSVHESLEFFHTPIIHLGNAGLHYPRGEIFNGYIIKPGPLPFVSRLEHTKSGLDPGIEFDFDPEEYEGEWFDAGDVVGYLEEHGIRIHPQSTYFEATINADSSFLQPFDNSGAFISPPESVFGGSGSNSTATDVASPLTPQQQLSEQMSPQQPQYPDLDMTFGSARLFPEIGSMGDTNWMNDSNAATGWLMGGGDRTPDFLSSGWASVTQPSSWNFADALPMEALSLPSPGVITAKPQRRIKIDVDLMIGGKFQPAL